MTVSERLAELDLAIEDAEARIVCARMIDNFARMDREVSYWTQRRETLRRERDALQAEAA